MTDGEYRWVKHRMIPLATDKHGCLLLCACIYTLATDEDRKAKFTNTRTGEVRILTNKDYENILSKREMEVLRLIDQGLLSKEISDNLCISINTVNRHRQNILQKLKVDRAIEACKLNKRESVTKGNNQIVKHANVVHSAALVIATNFFTS